MGSIFLPAPQNPRPGGAAESPRRALGVGGNGRGGSAPAGAGGTPGSAPGAGGNGSRADGGAGSWEGSTRSAGTTA
eukprot:6950943-Alexandrium_andersonii.AAC.1